MKSIQVLLAIFVAFFVTSAVAQINTADALTQKITSIAKRNNSMVGVAAIHIESNRKITYNGTMPFFMASTVKVPIALMLLHRVETNQESLDHTVPLGAMDAVPGSGTLCYMLNKKHLNVSLRKLYNLMLTQSDNSATDAILHEVNGPSAVQQWLQNRGFNHILVKRPILQIMTDANGASRFTLQHHHTSLDLQKAFNHVPARQKAIARKQFDNDMRDTTTPDDMALLLAALYKGKLLSAANTSLLLRTMEQCKTGNKRIKGLLPRGTVVAHKTGTWGLDAKNYAASDAKKLYGYSSDVGIITLPQNKGHIAIAVYVKSQSAGNAARSQVIASISRAVYDYFVIPKK